MSELFADTSGWGHLLDARQPFHALAADVYRQARDQHRVVVTTNYILAELSGLLTSPLRLPRPLIVRFIDAIKSSPYVAVVHVDAALDEEGWQLFRNRLDKEWSLVDCVSFTLMKRHGIQEALTADHHYSQAGFTGLLLARAL